MAGRAATSDRTASASAVDRGTRLAGRHSPREDVLVEPMIVQRVAQPYVGRRESISMTEFARVADHLPRMFDDLRERGVELAGAPFFRYRLIDMSAELVVEAGIPVNGPVELEEPSFADSLPAGRYATVVHIGHPDELVAVTAKLLDWAQREGLEWDMSPTLEGEMWGCRLEILNTDPTVEPDMHRWETILLFKLADEQQPADPELTAR
jgi:hypothetical protein